MYGGKMINRDDLSDHVFAAEKEFKKSGQKKFAIRKIASYDELSFQIIQRYINKFNKWVAEATDDQAEILYKRVHKAIENYNKEAFNNDEKRETEWYDTYDVYVVWTGPLPPTR
jgi:hypothetical protein